MSINSKHPLVVLTLTVFALIGCMATWFSAAAILPELQKAWSLTPSGLSWLTNAVQIGFVVGALGSSVLNLPDTISLRKLMAFGAILAGLSDACLLLTDESAIAIPLRFLTGVGLALVYPSSIKLMATWFQNGRGLVLGIIIGALTLGSALPHLFRSFAGGFDWQLVVMGTSITSVGASLIFLFSAYEGQYSFSKAPVDPKAIGRIFRDRGVMLANLGYFGHMWELYAMWGWFFAFALSANQSGLIGLDNHVSLFVFGVVASGVVGAVLGGWMSDRIGRCLTCAIMLGVSGFCALTIGFTFNGPLWLFAFVSVIWGISIIGDSAQFSAAVTELADQAYVGTALALQLGLGFGLTVIVIWLTPIVAMWIGWQWTFLILVPGPLVGVISMLILYKSPEALKLAGGRR